MRVRVRVRVRFRVRVRVRVRVRTLTLTLAEQVGLTDWAERTPGGFDARVGERGQALGGDVGEI